MAEETEEGFQEEVGPEPALRAGFRFGGGKETVFLICCFCLFLGLPLTRTPRYPMPVCSPSTKKTTR